MQTAEIIAIGSELLTPSRVDTNSLWLTERLNEIGIEVRMKTIVGDDSARLTMAIREALDRSPIVITSGGLGPTEDDKTRQCAAEAVRRPLIFQPQLMDEMRVRFEQLGVSMPDKNRSQAYAIEGARVLPNPNGTAAGMLLDLNSRLLAILPGPPRELQPMFIDHVWPRLREQAGEIAVRRKLLRVSGLGESAVDELIAPIYTQYDNPQTSTLINKTEIEVLLTAQAPTTELADRLNAELADRRAEKLGIAVVARDGETMEQVVGGLLVIPGKPFRLRKAAPVAWSPSD